MVNYLLRSSKRFIFVFLLFSLISHSQDNIWEKINDSYKTVNSNSKTKSTVYRLSTVSFESALNKISEYSTAVLSFPMNDDNGLKKFMVRETKVMHPDLARKFPNIKSYKGVALDGSKRTMQFTYSPNGGFFGVLQSTIYEKVEVKAIDKSLHEFKTTSSQLNNDPFECQTENLLRNKTNQFGALDRNIDDGNLRRYRLALSVSGDYSQVFLDGTESNDNERKAKVLQGMVNSINRLNGIFERDFGVTMQLIADTDLLIFLNPSTDPYSTGFNLRNELVGTINNTITNDDYDVGHLFHAETNRIYGNAGCIACVCTNNEKGQAYSVHGNPDTDDMNLLAAHEFGHQFGAYHTQSSGNCRSGFNSEVEPGSGSTIMSYAGICPPNIQASSDDYFNYTSIRDVAIWTIDNATCAELIPTGNAAPIVSQGLDYIIPISTPFVLEGIATDSDSGDTLTYCWEQNDPEDPLSVSSPFSNSTSGPMFRSFPPSSSSKRYFPNLSDVVANNITPTWEVLPSVSRTLNFVMTVRDNGVNGGQTVSDAVIINVADSAGPFSVTSQVRDTDVWTVGELVTVNWDVANTNLPPVGVSYVEIFVSTDGGLTFPTSIITTENDGEETFTLPDVDATSEARILIKAVDNVFFAVNQQNFTIEKSEYAILSEVSSINICDTEDAVFNLEYKTYLSFEEEVNISVSNLPSGVNVSLSEDTFTGTNANGTPFILTLEGLNTLTPGEYTFSIDGVSSSNIQKNLILNFTLFTSNSVSLNLILPEDDADSQDLDVGFSWEIDDNSTSYQLEIATDNTFTNIIDDVITTNASYTSSNLDYNQQYYWRVKTTNPCNDSDFSETFTFYTKCPTPEDFNIVNVTGKGASFEWLTNELNGNWELEYGVTGFSIGNGTKISVSEPMADISGLVPLTIYDVFIKTVCDVGGYSDNLGPYTFTTEELCSRPFNISTVSIINDIAVFNWENLNSDVSKWEVEYGLNGFSQGSGNVLEVTTKTVSINNLTSNTEYQFYIRSNCNSDGYSNWVGPIDFRTTPDYCAGDRFYDSGGEFGNYSDNENLTTVIYPKSPDERVRVIFNSFSLESCCDRLRIYDGPDAQSPLIGTYTSNPGNIVSTHESGALTFLFTSDGSVTRTGWDATVLCVEKPNCVAPNNFSVSNVQARQVDLFWEQNDDEASWTIEYGLDGFILGEGTELTSSTLNKTITDLIPDRSYDAYIKANCEIGGFSDVLGPISFNTTEACVTPTSFYVENVTKNTAELTWDAGDGTAWEIEYSSNYFTPETGAGIVESSTTNRLTIENLLPDTNYYAYVRRNCGEDGYSRWYGYIYFRTEEACVTPTSFYVENITKNTAELTWNAGDGTAWEIEYSSNYFTPGTGAGIVESSTTNRLTIENLLPDTNYYAYVRRNCGEDGYSRWYGYIYFRTEELCVTPTNFYVESVTKNTAELTWDAGDGTAWEIEYSSNYFTPGTGAGIVESSTTNRLTIENLLPDTNYYAYVRRNCGEDGYSWWYGYIYFRTEIACAMPTSFYAENITKNTAELTWDAGDGTEWEIEYSSNYFTPGTGVGIVESSTTNRLTIENLLPDTYYYAYVRRNCDEDGYSRWYGYIYFRTEIACAMPTSFYAENVTKNTAELTWDAGDGTAWEIEYSTNYFTPGTGVGIVESSTTNRLTIENLLPDTYYYAYVRRNCGEDGYSSWHGIIYFITEEACVAPTSFYAENITKNTAELTWDAGDGTEWEIEYSTNYFTPGTGVGIVESSTTNRLTIENLLPDTYYYAYVRRNCGEDGYSSWYGYIYFKTELTCASPINFESTDVTTNEAEFSWQQIGADSNWVLEYGLQGFSLGSGIEINSNSTSIIISDLEAATSYDIYIKTTCTDGGFSETIGPLNFVTDCTLTPIDNNLILNGSFECGSFAGWGTSGPSGSGCSQDFIVLDNSSSVCGFVNEIIPTHGVYAAFTSFDSGTSNVTYGLHQEITIPNNINDTNQAILSYDFKVNYEMTYSPTQERTLTVKFTDLDGNELFVVNELSFGLSPNIDSIDLSFEEDILSNLENYAGETIILSFEAFVPESFTGPSKALIDNIALTVDNLLSLNNNESLSNELVIYPVPNKGQFTVKSVSGEIIDTVEVFDVSGRLIQRNVLKNPSNKTDVNILNVDSGVYFVKVFIDGIKITKRIVIE